MFSLILRLLTFKWVFQWPSTVEKLRALGVAILSAILGALVGAGVIQQEAAALIQGVLTVLLGS